MRLGIEFSTFNGWVLLGLDGLGLRPLVQRHLAMGTRGGVWRIRCEPEGPAARCCAQCDGVEEIGVDEHVWRRTPFGSRYVTIIVDLTPRKKGGTARLLDMVEGRSEKAFTTWLQERGQAFRERVRVVAMDAFAGYKKAAARILPHAIEVAGQDATGQCQVPAHGHDAFAFGDGVGPASLNLRDPGIGSPTHRASSHSSSRVASVPVMNRS